MERKLAAILSADVHGYSQLMGEDEEATIRTLTAYRTVITALIQHHRGRVVDSPGDNLLAEFASAVDAVRCAVEIQRDLKGRNAALPRERRMAFRMGINVGDVIIEGERLYGDGVNIAARLEGLAEPGGICISGTVYDQIETKLALGYEYLGEQMVKNITKPVRVWRVWLEESERPKSQGQSLKSQVAGQPNRRVGPSVLVFVSVLLFGGIAAVRYLSLPVPSPQSLAPNLRSPTLNPQPLPLPDKPSIAVLPFTNMSGDPGQEYFSDGITEDLTTALSKLSGLVVIARHSTFVYKGRSVNLTEISKELGVRYVLEGSVRKADNRVRINAQLVEATTGHHVWAEQYDRELKDIFAVQDEIREKIVFALKVKLMPQEQERFRYLPTENLDAYDAVSRGREFFFRFTKEANALARQMFERAIELDPQYAAAYALLAWSYLAEFLFWNQDPQIREQAFETAQRAVALDDSLPVAHMTLGDVYLWRRQPEQAIAAAQRAIALDPNFADGYAHLGNILNSTGKPAEGLKMVEQAMRLNPRPPSYYFTFLGESYLRTGLYEEARATLKQALLRNPNFLPAYGNLAESYLDPWSSLQSHDPQALEYAWEYGQKMVALSESHPWAHSILARVYLWKRQHAQALAEAEQVITRMPDDANSYVVQASILSYAGQPEKAIAAVEQALRLNSHPPGWYFFALGQAYRLAGRVEEAIAAQQKALTLDPDEGVIYVELAVLYSERGRQEESQAAVSEFRKRRPHVSLENLKQVLVYKDPAETERVLAALRQSGLK